MNTQNHGPANNPSLQGAMAHAMLNADQRAASKPASAMHTILIRRDVQQRPVVFMPETFSKQDNKISYWSGDKNSGIQETTADYYFTSKPADADTVKEMTAKYANKFHAKEILVRQRLYKTGVLDRDEAGTTERVNVDDFKTRLLAAITKAVNETI